MSRILKQTYSQKCKTISGQYAAHTVKAVVNGTKDAEAYKSFLWIMQPLPVKDEECQLKDFQIE